MHEPLSNQTEPGNPAMVRSSSEHGFLEGPNLEKILDLSMRLKFSGEIETIEIFKRD